MAYFVIGFVLVAYMRELKYLKAWISEEARENEMWD